MTRETSAVATIVIGRNEGHRFIECLSALLRSDDVPLKIIYVDSGSTDGSVAAAKQAGIEVINLDLDRPFTAARARNAGLSALSKGHAPEFVQFLDGDCVIQPDWIRLAVDFLKRHQEAAVACGRVRERYPDFSVYNRLCDREWNTPIGISPACGGNAMMRLTALEAVGGFNSALIAGEEPELCLRMRREGWEIWRIDAEMVLHDAAMTRFSQFWKRMRRGGHAYAEGAAMHGAQPERHGVAGRNRALQWGLAIPVAVLVAALVLGPWALLALLVYPLQILRLARREGGSREAFEAATLLTVGKFAEALGVIEYHLNAWAGRGGRLIEYK